MSTLDDFIKRLSAALNEIEAEKVNHIVGGQWEEPRMRELVGEIRALRDIRNLIPEIQKKTEERTASR